MGNVSGRAAMAVKMSGAPWSAEDDDGGWMHSDTMTAASQVAKVKPARSNEALGEQLV
jgi:hypothetical protein